MLLRWLRDGISPFWAPVDGVRHGPSHKFDLIANGRSGREIELALKKVGIRVWAKQTLSVREWDDDLHRYNWVLHIQFRVKVHQARWAQYLLEELGVRFAPSGMYCRSSEHGVRRGR